MNKISIRFYNDQLVRAVWSEEENTWYFAIVDLVSAITGSEAPRKYWSVLKTRLKKQGNELTTSCSQLKLMASDGKRYLTDCLPQAKLAELAKVIPNKNAIEFLDWLSYSENTLDGQSRKKAYALFESGMLGKLEPGSIKCLQQIHAYIFGGLYDFAGQLRTKNISKGGFTFANCQYFSTILHNIEMMPETSFDEIVNKYVEMNVAHPFMEGNGRSTRIWLDLLLKRSLKKCIDWSRIDKNQYLEAMRLSVADDSGIRSLLRGALTDDINSREMFMKGIDYSYYYEQEDNGQDL